MIFRIFSPSLFFLGLSVVAFIFLGFFIPAQFEDVQMLQGIAVASKGAAHKISLFFLALTFPSFLYSSYRLYRWSQGKLDSCHQCLGLLIDKHGRYGYYQKCLACGKGQR